MKILWIALLMIGLLLGCGAEETFETMADTVVEEPAAVPQQLYVWLPDPSALPVFQDDLGTELYQCQGFTLTKQILEDGDLEKTLRTVSGYSSDQLQLLKTQQGTADRYDFVWTSAEEEGIRLGRACILDDGHYHYVVSTMTEERQAGHLQETLQEIFESCCLLSPDIDFNTGS